MTDDRPQEAFLYDSGETEQTRRWLLKVEIRTEAPLQLVILLSLLTLLAYDLLDPNEILRVGSVELIAAAAGTCISPGVGSHCVGRTGQVVRRHHAIAAWRVTARKRKQSLSPRLLAHVKLPLRC